MQFRPLFRLCSEKLSEQEHYDFGLRAMKSVILCSGAMKRDVIGTENELTEIQIVVKSLYQSVLPKLVLQDVQIFKRYNNYHVQSY